MLHVRKTVVEPPLAVELLDGHRRRALALPLAAGVRAPPVERRDHAVHGVARRDDYVFVLGELLRVKLSEMNFVVRDVIQP